MLEVFELREGKWLLLDVFHDNADVAALPFAKVSFPWGCCGRSTLLPKRRGPSSG